jgi:predicted alpha-1,6-mannanase (GH76 family)
MQYRIILIVLATILSFTDCKKDTSSSSSIYQNHATIIFRALQGIQYPVNHLWERCGWWGAANLLEAILDYHRQNGTSYTKGCKEIFDANKYFWRGGFKNEYYDDNGWWGLAWVKAYEQCGDPLYLATSEDIFADMVAVGWDDVCGGGMSWQTNVRYKNAITNELFITLATRLAQNQKDSQQKQYYIDWAKRGWDWLLQSGIRNADLLYNDGLDNCINNGQTTWTYNQGVILGGLKNLYLLTGDERYLEYARETAFAAIRLLSDSNGILTETCTGDCGVDAPQFKGIFIRYLSELNLILKDKSIKSFISHNADIAWANGRNERYLFDVRWQGPFSDWRGTSTGSALDLMNAAALQATW